MGEQSKQAESQDTGVVVGQMLVRWTAQGCGGIPTDVDGMCG